MKMNCISKREATEQCKIAKLSIKYILQKFQTANLTHFQAKIVTIHFPGLAKVIHPFSILPRDFYFFMQAT